MEFAVFPSSEWSTFSRLSQSVIEIEAKCIKILEHLKEAFERDSLLGANVCSVNITRDTHELALIKSPVGNGRVIQQWSRSSRELQGKLIFQREQYDSYDQRYWETVWGITVPRYDDAYSGTEAKALSFDFDGFSGDPRNIVFTAAMSILAGLVDGPQKSTDE